VSEWRGCLGTYDRNYGGVTFADDVLTLHPQFTNDEEGIGISEQFVVIRWGERRYLISPRDIERFAADVAAGHEPRTSLWGSFILRHDDETKPAPGLPQLPTRFRQRFLTAMSLAATRALSLVKDGTQVAPADATASVPLDWETAAPASVGLEAVSIAKAVELVKSGEYKNIHSVLLVKDGKLIIEEYFRGQEEDGQEREYDRTTKHGIHSATKSINALLFGIAIQQRSIRDVETKLSALFPEYADIFKDPNKDAIRLQHLLSMTAGLSWNEWEVPYSDPRNDHVAMNASADTVRYVLERPLVARPGAKFGYSSGLSIVLGEVIHKATGQRPDEFAKRHLFEPLGISDYVWLKYPSGIVQTGGGLYLRPRDMAKIGQLVLDGGRWQGKQIVPEAWLRESTKKQAPDAQYGYQWWLGSLRAGDREIATFAAQGRGGQFILILPELKMVAVFTSWNDGNNLGEQPLDMMRRYILPAALQNTRPEGRGK
jgi:CubicO group peptidase (beta-lactamase class C family)